MKSFLKLLVLLTSVLWMSCATILDDLDIIYKSPVWIKNSPYLFVGRSPGSQAHSCEMVSTDQTGDLIFASPCSELICPISSKLVSIYEVDRIANTIAHISSNATAQKTSPPLSLRSFLELLEPQYELLMAPDCIDRDVCYSSLCETTANSTKTLLTKGPVHNLLLKSNVFTTQFDHNIEEESSYKWCNYNSYPKDGVCVNCPTGYSSGTGQQEISDCFLCGYGRHVIGSEGLDCQPESTCESFTPGVSNQFFGSVPATVAWIVSWTGSSWYTDENSNLPIEQFIIEYFNNLERACIDTTPADFGQYCTKERYLGPEYADLDPKTYLKSAVYPPGYPNLKGTYSYFSNVIPLFGFEPSGTNNCGNKGSTNWYYPNPGNHYPHRTESSLGQSELCPAGYWCPGGTIPLPCPPGTYSTETGQTHGNTCQPCPAGTFSNMYGLSSSEECVPCPSFTYSTKTGLTDPSQCTPCPTGYISSPRSSSPKACYLCSADQYYDSTTHTCPVVHSCNSFVPLVKNPSYPGYHQPVYVFSTMTLNRETLEWSQEFPSENIEITEWLTNLLDDMQYICQKTSPQGYEDHCADQFPNAPSVVSEYIVTDSNSEVYFIKPIPTFGNRLNTGSQCANQRSDYIEPVPPGKYWGGQSQDFIGNYEDCPEGAWCPGGTPPIYCPPGTYSTESNQVNGEVCRQCPPGRLCLGGSQNTICPDGYECLNRAEKIPCPRGHWCTSSQGMQACPDGTYSNQVGQSSSDTCKPCISKYFCPGGSPLLPCPPGTFSDTGDIDFYKSCQPCPKGHMCPGGEFASPCTPGTYQPKEGQSTCIETEPFTTSTYGDLGFTPCLPPFCGNVGSLNYFASPILPQGLYAYYHNGLPQMAEIPRGFYRPFSSYYLSSCPSMHFCEGGLTEPVPCPPHLISEDVLSDNNIFNYSSDSISLQYTTLFNTTVSVSGRTECIGVPGYQLKDQVFQECPAGTFSNSSTDYLCSYCPPGFYSKTGSQKCVEANAGYCVEAGCTSPSGSYPCRPGSYCIWRDGTLIETPCPPGFYCPGLDSLPIACTTGNYCDESAMSEPKLCTGWSYTPAHIPDSQQQAFSSYPIILEPGYSTTVLGTPSSAEKTLLSGWASCMQPPLDTYALSNSPNMGNTFYHYCPPHQYADSTTNNECNECQEGYGYDQNTRQCIECSGYISSYNRTSISYHDTICPCGQFLYNGLCVLAPIGSYIPLPVCNITISDTPIPCPEGTFTAATGSWNCQPCPNGDCSTADIASGVLQSPYYEAELANNLSSISLPEPIRLPYTDNISETHVYYNNSVDGLAYHVHNYTFVRATPTFNLENGTFVKGPSLILVHETHNEKDILYINKKPLKLLSLMKHNKFSNTKIFKYTDKLTLPDVVFSIKGDTTVHTQPISMEIKQDDMVCLDEFLANTKLLDFFADNAPTSIPSYKNVSSDWQMMKKSVMDGLRHTYANTSLHMPDRQSIKNAASGVKSTFSSAAKYWTNSTNIDDFDKKALPALGVGKELYDTITTNEKPLCLRVSAKHSMHTGFHLDYEFFKIRELITSNSADSSVGVMLPGQLELKESSPIILFNSGMFHGGLHLNLLDGLLKIKIAPYMGFEIDQLALSGGNASEYVYGIGHRVTHSSRFDHHDGNKPEVTGLLHNQEISDDYFLLKPFSEFGFNLTTQFGVQLSVDATIFSFGLLFYDQPGISGRFEASNAFLCPSRNNSLEGTFKKTNNLILGLDTIKVLGLPIVPAIHEQWTLLDAVSEPTCLSNPKYVPIGKGAQQEPSYLAMSKYKAEILPNIPSTSFDNYRLVSSGTKYKEYYETISPTTLKDFLSSNISHSAIQTEEISSSTSLSLQHRYPTYSIEIIDIASNQTYNVIPTHTYYQFHFNNHSSYRGLYVTGYTQTIDLKLSYNNGSHDLVTVCFANNFANVNLTYTDSNGVPLRNYNVMPIIVEQFKSYLFNSISSEKEQFDNIIPCVTYNIHNKPPDAQIKFYPRIMLNPGTPTNISIENTVEGAAINEFPWILDLPPLLFTDLDRVTLKVICEDIQTNETVPRLPTELYGLEGINSTQYYYTAVNKSIIFASYDLKFAPYLSIRLLDQRVKSAVFNVELVTMSLDRIGTTSDFTITPVLTDSLSKIVPYTYFTVKINTAITDFSLAKQAYRLYEEGRGGGIPLVTYDDALLVSTTNSDEGKTFLVKLKNEVNPPKRCISTPLKVYPNPIDNAPLPQTGDLFAPAFISGPDVKKLSMTLYNSFTGKVQPLEYGTGLKYVDGIFGWPYEPIKVQQGMSVQVTANAPLLTNMSVQNNQLAISHINTVYEISVEEDCYITSNSSFYTLPNNIENTFIYASNATTLLVYSPKPITLFYKPQTTMPKNEIHVISYNNGSFITRTMGGINIAEKPLLKSLNIRVCDPLPRTEQCLIQDMVKRISHQTIEITVPFDAQNIEKDLFITQGLGIPGNPKLVSVIVTDSGMTRLPTLSSFRNYPEAFEKNSLVCNNGFWRLSSLQQAAFPNQPVCQVCPPGYYCINNDINQCPVGTTSSDIIKSQCVGILEWYR